MILSTLAEPNSLIHSLPLLNDPTFLHFLPLLSYFVTPFGMVVELDLLG